MDTEAFERLFERALATSDEAYLWAESQLRERIPEQAAALRESLAHDDPLGQLMAKVMLDWSEAQSETFEKADKYLDVLPAYFRRTAALQPPVRGVEQTLTAAFGPRLSEFLALRLAKQRTWPNWRVMSTLAYLDRHKNPATTVALIRFAAQTAQPAWRTAAVEVLRALRDPMLAQKIADERRRVQQQGGALPPALTALA